MNPQPVPTANWICASINSRKASASSGGGSIAGVGTGPSSAASSSRSTRSTRWSPHSSVASSPQARYSSASISSRVCRWMSGSKPCSSSRRAIALSPPAPGAAAKIATRVVVCPPSRVSTTRRAPSPIAPPSYVYPPLSSSRSSASTVNGRAARPRRSAAICSRSSSSRSWRTAGSRRGSSRWYLERQDVAQSQARRGTGNEIDTRDTSEDRNWNTHDRKWSDALQGSPFPGFSRGARRPSVGTVRARRVTVTPTLRQPESRGTARSRRWLVLPIALALALWLVVLRERERAGREGMQEVPGEEPVTPAGPELVQAGEGEPSSASSTPERMPAPGFGAEEPAERFVTFRLRVVEEGTRLPIAGARVLSHEKGSEGELETDAEGTCALVCPEAELWPGFHVSKEGFVHLATQLEREPVLEVALSRGATLTGRVLADDTGAPVSGARLRVDHSRCRCDATAVESDPSGRYELPCVPRHESWTRIEIHAAGLPLHERTFELRSDAARIEQDFRLERGLEITGRVVDYTSGAGVPGALVADFPADDAGRFRSWVAADGASSEVKVDVSAPGYCRLTARCARSELERAGELELRLPRSVAVEGVVRDVEGEPLAGAYIGSEIEDEDERDGSEPPEIDPVQAELPPGWSLGMERVGQASKTDAAGRFRLEGLVPWERHLSVWAGMEGHELVAQRPVLGAPGSASWLEFVLRPEPGASVSTVMGNVSLDGMTGWWDGTLSWKGPSREGRVELQNGFQLEVEPGEVHFHLALAGVAGPIEGDSFVLTLAPGVNIDHDIELRLPPAPIAGRVRFQDGTPASKASVGVSQIVPGGRPYQTVRLSTESAADGSFQLDVPDLGSTYRLEASLGHERVTLA